MRRLGGFFLFKFLNYIIIIFFFFFLGGGGVQKYKYFGGYEDFVDILGGSRQNWTSLGCLFYVF